MGSVQIVIVVIAAVAGLIVFLGLSWGFLRVVDPEAKRSKDEYARVKKERAASMGVDDSTRMMGVARAITRYIPMSRGFADSIQDDLASAGFSRSSVVTWWVTEVIMVLVGLAVGVVLFKAESPAQSIAILLALMVGASVLPRVYLLSLKKKRQKAIAWSLPSALDLLAAVCFAGCTLDDGMAELAENTHGPLADEFGTVAFDLTLGITRQEALGAMVRRCQVPEVTAFVSSMLDAQKTGMSVADVLMGQAKQLRVRQSLKVEEEANKLPIKMLPALSIFIFPVTLLVVIAPMLSSFSSSMAAM